MSTAQPINTGSAGPTERQWQRTKDPSVVYNSRKEKWTVRVPYRKIGSTGKYSYRYSGSFGTKAEAEASMLTIREGMDPITTGKPPNKTRTAPDDDAVQNMAFKRARRELEWDKLTLDQWQNHSVLRNYKTIDDIPKHIRMRLDLEFRSYEPDTATRTDLRYMLKRTSELHEKAKDFSAKASTLLSRVPACSVHELLRCEITDEQGQTNIVMPSKESITSAQTSRVIVQAMIVSQLLSKLAEREISRAESLEKDIEKLLITSRAQESGGGPDMATIRKTIKEEQKKERSSYDSVEKMAKAVLQEVNYAGEMHLSIRLLLDWFNSYIKRGYFMQDGRGVYERSAVIEMYPGFLNSLKSFIRAENSLSVERIQTYISQLLRTEVERASSENRDDGLAVELESRGIDVSKGISKTTAYYWIKKAGAKYSAHKQTFVLVD